jgi:sigma-B regulation protein RsbU (phosphoserine phosphatase)
MEGGNISLSAGQKEWLTERKCALLLPLATKDELVGFLAVSCKANGEDFSSEELELLESFSAHIALAAENLKLMRERLEKQRLQEQISMARAVQEGLLPKDIPTIPGLEVSALIRFCMDVAGDYYDIITFDDGRVVFAIGDVAGKGIGPALLMANLQASLRTAAEMDIPLREAAAKINTLVYENTPPELFITFFFASVDPASGTIEYVNAGHNPPLLLGGGGRRKELCEGGLLLGVVPSASYRQGVAEFRPGDTLLMYTDGVSEAMNDLEEEFGENRIAGLAMANSDMKLSGMLQKIEEEVRSFQQSPDFRDDFTLLAVRQSSSGAVGLQHGIV